MNVLEVTNLSFAYTNRPVLRDLSFNVPKASFLAIAGPNGAGKTTLINLLSAALKPKSGSIKIGDQKIKRYSTAKLAEKIAVVRQEFIPVFGFSVIETVMMARTTHYNRMGFETKTDRKIVTDALDATETTQFASRQLAQLSGGERQRVFIARALAQNTDILLLDEPTTFLDLRHQVQIYDLLKKSQLENGKTIVAITHDINLAAQYCDHVLLLDRDADYHMGPPAEIFSQENIEKVFDIKTLTAQIGKQKFFLPMGNFAKDHHDKTP